MKAQIMDIKRFAVHDGDGIRTTIFFKGCPLRCVWCHNPEGLMKQTQLSYNEHKCISCGSCKDICMANRIVDGKHVFDRSACDACGACERICPSGCFKVYGKECTVDQLLEIVQEDMDFYESSGGGVTLSGGECLLQADFCRELLKRCKEAGIHTAVDTCGYVSKDAIDKVMPYTDIFLYDIKAIDEDVHVRCTGHTNQLILDNLRYLTEQGNRAEIRVPLVPGYNAGQVEKIGQFLKGIDNITDVKVLAYHNLSETKYASLDMVSHMPQCDVPTRADVLQAEAIIKQQMNFVQR